MTINTVAGSLWQLFFHWFSRVAGAPNREAISLGVRSPLMAFNAARVLNSLVRLLPLVDPPVIDAPCQRFDSLPGITMVKDPAEKPVELKPNHMGV